MSPTDAGPADAAPPGDSGPTADAGPMADAGPPADAEPMGDAEPMDDAGPSCPCDVTSLCDTGCSCDIACSVVPGLPPIGSEAEVLQRAETAVYYPSASSSGPIDHVQLFDDSYSGVGAPTSPFAQLFDGSHATISEIPRVIAADVDGDGRDEAVIETSTGLTVEDWDGSSLTSRSVYAFALPSSLYDMAAGDLTGDGVPELVVSREFGPGAVIIQVFQVGTSGMASVLASTSLTGVTRQALAVAPLHEGGTPKLWALVASLGATGSPETLTLHRFTVSGSSLVDDAPAQSLGSPCTIAPTGLGMSLVGANLDTDPDIETAYALYCPNGDLHVGVVDPGGTGATDYSGIADDALPATTLFAGLRPFLVAGRFGPTPSSPPSLALGLTVDPGRDYGATPRAHVAELQYASGTLTRRNAKDLTTPVPFAGDSVLTSLTSADTNRDDTDEIAAGASHVTVSERSAFTGCMTATDCTVYTTGSFADMIGASLSGPPRTLVDVMWSSSHTAHLGAVAVMGDFDGDSVRVRATGNVYLHTGPPFVNAVLAGPPTWLGRAGVTNTGCSSSATSFGTTMTSGTTDTHTINATAAVTVSGGLSFGVAHFSAGVTVSTDLSSSTSFDQSVSYGTETTVGEGSDLVLYRIVPYASYEYQVVADPDPTLVGTDITVDVPGAMVETTRSLAGFRAEYGAMADAIIPPTLFTHTIGDPTTYPPPADCTEAAIQSRLGSAAGTVSEVAVSPSLVDVGNAPSGSRTQSISVATETGMATDMSLSVDLSVGVGAGGVSFEASAGIGTGYTHETTIGQDVSYTGQVPFLATGYGPSTMYQWGLCVYHYSDPQHGAFPVVDYVVQ